MSTHEHYMRLAIAEARKAAEIGEVPIGAIAMADDKVIGSAHNIREATGNPLGHAELLLIEKLVNSPSPHCGVLSLSKEGEGQGEGEQRNVIPLPLGERAGVRGSWKNASWRLEDVTIYVTCEPCIMCMGALLQARVPRLIFGCLDPKAGACGSLYDLSNDKRLNHRIDVTSGVLVDECGKLLRDFFRGLRIS